MVATFSQAVFLFCVSTKFFSVATLVFRLSPLDVCEESRRLSVLWMFHPRLLRWALVMVVGSHPVVPTFGACRFVSRGGLP